MGKASKALKTFIEGIPDNKLQDITDGEHTIFKDTDFRLDMQGKTSGDPQSYNLQVQINNETTISTLKKEKGKTVSTALVPIDGTWSPQEIRNKLISSMKL
ncbi:hypothetical protein HRG_012463 [Hirsutella rhossiliensis]